MATIAENIQTLRSIKSDIKNAIIQKGGSVTDAFGTYAQAITNLPSGGGGGTEIEDGLITKTLSGTYYNDRVSEVGNYVFGYCYSLTSIDLPLCSYVGNYAFQYCSSLTYVNLPKCTYLSNGVFTNCLKLTSIYLPLCTYVGINVFGRCLELTSIYLPLCTSVGEMAFQNCSELSQVYLNSVTRVTTIFSKTFSNCPNLTSIYVPASLVDAFKTAQNWSSISGKIVAYTGA